MNNGNQTNQAQAGNCAIATATITTFNDSTVIIISPGDIVYFVTIPNDNHLYCKGFHYKSLTFFKFNQLQLSLFRPILIEQDVIDMNVKYSNNLELEAHLRHAV